MGELLRLIILALAVWLVWRWITGHRWVTRRVDSCDRNAMPSGCREASKASHDEPSTQMAKCAKCKLYLPADAAFHFQKRHFCCQQHQRDYSNKYAL